MNEAIPLSDLPVSIQKVVVRARQLLRPDAIILYGSRARNEGSAVSDFDFAMKGVKDDKAWTRFFNYVQHEAPTLFRIDLVRYESVQRDLQESIDREGRLVDERKAA